MHEVKVLAQNHRAGKRRLACTSATLAQKQGVWRPMPSHALLPRRPFQILNPDAPPQDQVPLSQSLCNQQEDFIFPSSRSAISVLTKPLIVGGTARWPISVTNWAGSPRGQGPLLSIRGCVCPWWRLQQECSSRSTLSIAHFSVLSACRPLGHHLDLLSSHVYVPTVLCASSTNPGSSNTTRWCDDAESILNERTPLTLSHGDSDGVVGGQSQDIYGALDSGLRQVLQFGTLIRNGERKSLDIVLGVADTAKWGFWRVLGSQLLFDAILKNTIILCSCVWVFQEIPGIYNEDIYNLFLPGQGSPGIIRSCYCSQ